MAKSAEETAGAGASHDLKAAVAVLARSLHITKEMLLREAHRTWQLVRDVVDDDNALYSRLMSQGDPRLAYGDGQITALGLARWAQDGFPQVTMGHKFCAALLCTGVGEEALEHVRPPWRAFFIEVPNGMFYIDSEMIGRTAEVQRILVTRIKHATKGETWAYVAYTDSTAALWRFGATTAELLPPIIEGTTAFREFLQRDSTAEDLTDRDGRVSTLIGRLIINTCLALSDKANVKQIGPGHKVHAAGRNKRTEREPVVRTFQVGKPIKLDLRETVASFIQHGDRAAPSVQVLVRGHYKTQRHGPKNSLTKVIWLEPYWRGPEDAPILTRPHEMSKE